ncbi:MAG: hypothetical protein ABIB47_05775 [Candidatus Woesearchaeota archaeon]
MNKRRLISSGMVGLTALVLGCPTPVTGPRGTTPPNNGPINPPPIVTPGDPEQRSLRECLEDISEARIRQIARQGGKMNPSSGTFRNYKSVPVAYLCYNIKDRAYCRPRVVRRNDIEMELEEYIRQDVISNCLNDPSLSIQITIKDDVTTVSASTNSLHVTSSIDLPLGRLYEVQHDIVNAEATNGTCDTVEYSATQTQLGHQLYYVTMNPIYPDKLYTVTIKEFPGQTGTLLFQFFIEGEPR